MGSNYSSGLKCELGAHSVETLSWRKSGNILYRDKLMIYQI